MAYPQTSEVRPNRRINSLEATTIAVPERHELTERTAGPVLFLGGTAFAAAYVVLGVTGLTAWGGLLAIAGSVFVLLGLSRLSSRAQ